MAAGSQHMNKKKTDNHRYLQKENKKKEKNPSTLAGV
jgi:hypothetical protein